PFETLMYRMYTPLSQPFSPGLALARENVNTFQAFFPAPMKNAGGESLAAGVFAWTGKISGTNP
ncbi:hypothetical protein C3F00_035250, partial [Pseudomonas sp. MWU13-2860]